ncbi:hypothetical protein [Salinicola halophyticus]
MNGTQRFFQIQRSAFEGAAIGTPDVLTFTVVHRQMELVMTTD